MNIRLLITGGTFDKEYDEIHGLLYFRDTHVGEMLRLGRCRLNITVQTLLMKDSLEMTDLDRSAILTACRESKEDRVVITHGTDTMVDTARFLANGILDKTVVLTGAMVPYAFGSSDGLFNLGSAVSFAQVLSSGVYVAMNGMYFSWDSVRKNRELGLFESLK